MTLTIEEHYAALLAADAKKLKGARDRADGKARKQFFPNQKKARVDPVLSDIEKRILDMIEECPASTYSFVQAGIGTMAEVQSARSRLAILNLIVAERTRGKVLLWKIRPKQYGKA